MTVPCIYCSYAMSVSQLRPFPSLKYLCPTYCLSNPKHFLLEVYLLLGIACFLSDRIQISLPLISRHYMFFYISTIGLTSLRRRVISPLSVPLQASYNTLHVVGDQCSPDIKQSCPKVLYQRRRPQKSSPTIFSPFRRGKTICPRSFDYFKELKIDLRSPNSQFKQPLDPLLRGVLYYSQDQSAGQ